MRRVLLRVGRSRVASSDEAIDVQRFLDAEKLEGSLALSVYLIEEPDGAALAKRVTQAHAEHQASAGVNPPKAGYDLDIACDELPEPRATPGTSRFQFTREAHRDVTFADPAHRRRVFEKVLAERAARLFKVTRVELAAYAASRVSAEDAEWLAVLARPAGKAWTKLIAKWAKSQPGG